MPNIDEIRFAELEESWGKITHFFLKETVKTRFHNVIKLFHLENWFDLYEERIIMIGSESDNGNMVEILWLREKNISTN